MLRLTFSILHIQAVCIEIVDQDASAPQKKIVSPHKMCLKSEGHLHVKWHNTPQ